MKIREQGEGGLDVCQKVGIVFEASFIRPENPSFTTVIHIHNEFTNKKNINQSAHHSVLTGCVIILK